MVKNKDERDEDDIDEEDRDDDDDDRDDKDGKGKEKDDSVEVDDDKDKDKNKSKIDDDIEIVKDDDERLVDSSQVKKPNEESQEEKRERRRKEKQQKREKRLAAERRDKQRIQQLARENEQIKQQMAQLQGMVPQFQQRLATQDELQVDNAMQQQQGLYQSAMTQLNKAITEGNGAAAEQAQRIIDDARDKYSKLSTLKQNIAASRQVKDDGADDRTQTQQQGRSQEGEMLKIYRKRWVTENDWYDPDGSDDESTTARAIDKALVREGFDPNHKDFWTEFQSRIKEELPHLFEKKEERVKPRPRQTNGSVVHDSAVSESGKLRIPQRVVQMAKDAGIWDDEKKRKMFINNWKQQNGVAV